MNAFRKDLATLLAAATRRINPSAGVLAFVCHFGARALYACHCPTFARWFIRTLLEGIALVGRVERAFANTSTKGD